MARGYPRTALYKRTAPRSQPFVLLEGSFSHDTSCVKEQQRIVISCCLHGPNRFMDSLISTKFSMRCTAPSGCAAGGADAGRDTACRVVPPHHLRSRDMLFGAFMCLTYVLYLFKAVPELCSIGPPEHNNARISTGEAGLNGSADWPLSWQLVCGHLTSESSGSRPGMLLMPAIFSPLLQATRECSSSSSSNRTDGGRVDWPLGVLSCGWSHVSLLVASKALRVLLILSQVGSAHLLIQHMQICITGATATGWPSLQDMQACLAASASQVSCGQC